ncbi:MAG: hypothetical protein SVU69_00545 [Pseudomonadota bacterium]|nr:hypothetical protein [Pseudomonadota bacterium]
MARLAGWFVIALFTLVLGACADHDSVGADSAVDERSTPLQRAQDLNDVLEQADQRQREALEAQAR